MKGKGISPAEAKRKATVKVLKLFEGNEPQKWPGLWEKAKRRGISYPTLKHVITRLVKAGLIKASVDEKNLTSVFTLIASLPQILYLHEVVNFLEKQFEKWRSAIEIEETKHDRPPSPEEGFAPAVLFSEDPWERLKRYVTREDELKLREIQLVLFSIRGRMALDEFPENEKQLIHKYEKTVKDLVDKTYKLDKEVRGLIEIVAKETRKDTQDLEKKLEEIAKGMDISLIMFDPKQIDRVLSECEPEKRAEVEPLVNWLKENRENYDKYLEQQKQEPKLLLAVGAGFGEYTEQCTRLARMFPLEWVLTEDQKADSKLKEEVKKILEGFGERSVRYRCEKCLSLFDKRKQARNHIKRVHHRTDVEILIQEVDKAYYLELLDSLCVAGGSRGTSLA